MSKGITAAAVLVVALPVLADEIQRVSVTVEGANDDYTPTGITVKKGDLVLIGASGEVITGAWMGKTDPNGHVGRCGGSDTDGALMFKIGSTAAEKAGRHKLGIAGAAGELKLKVRDTKYSDNKGTFTVDVIKLPARMTPPAPTKLAVDVANDEWTPSDITVSVGDLVIVIAEAVPGTIHLVNADHRASGTPEGLRCDGTVRVQSDNDAALMMKIGTSEYRRAGAFNFVIADAAGPVKFRSRLKHPAGNKGTYNVAVFKFPMGTIPLSDNIASAE